VNHRTIERKAARDSMTRELADAALDDQYVIYHDKVKQIWWSLTRATGKFSCVTSRNVCRLSVSMKASKFLILGTFRTCER
jgi:hypothetical protein